MSRVGKHPVNIPDGVEVQIAEKFLKAKGKLGELQLPLNDNVSVKLEDKTVIVEPKGSSKFSKAMWGTMRRLINNTVSGVSEGFSVTLDIVGVGYRAQVQGKNLQLQLGFSHDVLFPIPEGITIKCTKPTQIIITGADKQKVGQVAAEIRSYRPPEPYKGKGVKYENEVILRKEGKKK